jgi:prophage DNA circulation protein
MAYLKDKLRRASFRSVPFQVEDADLAAGRRVQLHEYPQRDKPYVEDIGRATRRVEVAGFVVGATYVEQANALLIALETAGPGELIHPWLGAMKVTVAEISRVKFDSGLGKASFDLAFVEAGELVFPGATTATDKVVRAAAATLQQKASAAFASTFRVLGYVNRVTSAALSTYSNVLGVLANPVGTVTSMIGYGSLLGNLSSLAALFGQPVTLAANFAGLLNISGKMANGSLIGSATTPQEVDRRLIPASRGLLAMAADPTLAPPVQPTDTAIAVQQAWTNTVAINAHARQTLLVQAAGIASYVQCAIYDDAIALRNALVAALDAEMLRATDDDLYRALADARSAVFQDLTERSRDSSRLLTITPATILPALVIAYDYYEDANRDADIVSRNGFIHHPGFVPPRAVQVLSR